MRYFLDCEFFGMGGDIISLALAPENSGYYDELYIAFDQKELEAESWIVTLAEERRWVRQHVLPIVDAPYATPERIGVRRSDVAKLWPERLNKYFEGDPRPHIIADWPDDIAYMCKLLLTGPGTAIGVAGMSFEWVREDAYPTKLDGAVQHNALWDARVLKDHMLQKWRRR